MIMNLQLLIKFFQSILDDPFVQAEIKAIIEDALSKLHKLQP